MEKPGIRNERGRRCQVKQVSCLEGRLRSIKCSLFPTAVYMSGPSSLFVSGGLS